jgi:predicted ATPase
MYKINRIEITGFRRLDIIDLEIRPFVTPIGTNGVGKTSFLDALTLLSASALGNLQETLSKFGGIANLQTRGKNDGISFLVDMDVPGYEPLEYSLHLVPQGARYIISQEVLSQRRSGHDSPFKHIDSMGSNIRYYETGKGLVSPTWEYDPLEASLSQVQRCSVSPKNYGAFLPLQPSITRLM